MMETMLIMMDEVLPELSNHSGLEHLVTWLLQVSVLKSVVMEK